MVQENNKTVGKTTMKENIKPATTKQLNYLVKLGASDDQLKDIDIISASKLIKELVKKTNKLVNTINNESEPKAQDNEKAKKQYFSIVDQFEESGRLDMNSYFKKECSNAYKNSYGQFVIFKKPIIKTNFCFGYGYCGVTDEESENRANNNAEVMRTSQDAFIRKNLEELDHEINLIKLLIEYKGESYRLNWQEEHKKYFKLAQKYNLRESQPEYLDAYYINYSNDTYWNNREVANIHFVNDYNIKNDEYCRYKNATIHKLTIIELKRQLKYLLNEKLKFMKRLNTYLKKYGLNKLNIWTYLVD